MHALNASEVIHALEYTVTRLDKLVFRIYSVIQLKRIHQNTRKIKENKSFNK